MSNSTTTSDEEPRRPRLVSRRAALGAVGLAGGAAFLAACGSRKVASAASSATATAPSAVPSAATSGASSASSSAAAIACAVLTKEQEQGPYYYPAALVRADIADGLAGVPLKLQFTIVDAVTCQPIPSAGIDIWQADPLGAYSDTSTKLYLRGIQLTGADGVATFTTIYPGWYPGRTNHIHIKVHDGGTAATTYTGGHVSHTGNVFFPEVTSLAVAKLAPYTSNTAHRVVLTQDGVYSRQNGSGSILTLTPVSAADASQGYVGAITLGIDPNATPTAIGISGTVK